MSEDVDIASRVMPSASPTEADIAAWQALSRDEQLRRLQETLAHADCTTASAATMSDILRRAQAAAKPRHG